MVQKIFSFPFIAFCDTTVDTTKIHFPLREVTLGSLRWSQRGPTVGGPHCDDFTGDHGTPGEVQARVIQNITFIA